MVPISAPHIGCYDPPTHDQENWGLRKSPIGHGPLVVLFSNQWKFFTHAAAAQLQQCVNGPSPSHRSDRMRSHQQQHDIGYCDDS